MKNEDKKVRIKLERHMWPDEMEESQSKFQKRLMTIFVVVSLIFVFLAGWLIGSAKPINFVQTPDQKIETKLDSILDIMSQSWYFAKDNVNIRDSLLDQALKGMTTSEMDPHTTYLSNEDLQNFTQSINLNFVGIGVQYIATDGLNVIDRVFKNSPAEESGVLPGDIINKVDGVVVEGLTSDEIKDKVRGESGSIVSIEFLRQGQPVVIDITRREVSGTTYGKMLEENIGYLEIYQFGDSTGYEVEAYLDEMTASGMSELVIDLRDNGGGYLDAFVDVVSYFVDEGVIVMKQEYADGSISDTKSKEGKYDSITGIVVLVNQNSASASEVLTLALKELRDDVTVLGTTSYGKGTVQITQPFSDGSALKYTSSKWLSPNGKSIDGVGIEPDVEIRLHNILYETYLKMEDTDVYVMDQVSNYIRIAQEGLDYLDYTVTRTDGYFDEGTTSALKQFEKDNAITVDGVLDTATFEAIISSIFKEWSLDTSKDSQLSSAIQHLKEK